MDSKLLCIFCHAQGDFGINAPTKAYVNHLLKEHCVQRDLEDVLERTVNLSKEWTRDARLKKMKLSINKLKNEDIKKLIVCSSKKRKLSDCENLKGLPWFSGCEYQCQFTECGQMFHQVSELISHFEKNHCTMDEYLQTFQAYETKTVYVKCRECFAQVKHNLTSIQDHLLTEHSGMTMAVYEKKHSSNTEPPASKAAKPDGKNLPWYSGCQFDCQFEGCGSKFNFSPHLVLHIKADHCSPNDYLNRFGGFETKTVFINCRECGQKIKQSFADIKCHMLNRHRMSMGDYELKHSLVGRQEVGNRTFDGWVDRCTFTCKLCDSDYKCYGRFLTHVQTIHGISIVDYKEKFGSDLGRTVMHNCLICDKPVLHAKVLLRAHVSKRHGLTINKYYKKYIAKESEKTDGLKKDDEGSEIVPEWIRWSNKCSYKCKICSVDFDHFAAINRHIKEKHALSITAYVKKHGTIWTKVVMHECKMCNTRVTHDKAKICQHLSDCHNVQLKEYYNKFILKHHNSKTNCDVEKQNKSSNFDASEHHKRRSSASGASENHKRNTVAAKNLRRNSDDSDAAEETADGEMTFGPEDYQLDKLDAIGDQQTDQDVDQNDYHDDFENDLDQSGDDGDNDVEEYVPGGEKNLKRNSDADDHRLDKLDANRDQQSDQDVDQSDYNDGFVDDLDQSRNEGDNDNEEYVPRGALKSLKRSKTKSSQKITKDSAKTKKANVTKNEMEIWGNQCKYWCQICSTEIRNYNQVMKHMRGHDTTITQYRETHGDIVTHGVIQTCQICSSRIPHDLDKLRDHLKKAHPAMNVKLYYTNYIHKKSAKSLSRNSDAPEHPSSNFDAAEESVDSGMTFSQEDHRLDKLDANRDQQSDQDVDQNDYNDDLDQSGIIDNDNEEHVPRGALNSLKRSKTKSSQKITNDGDITKKAKVTKKEMEIWGNQCKFWCQICSREMRNYKKMKMHMRNHDITITQYRQTHGDIVCYSVIHICQICSCRIPHDLGKISDHLYTRHHPMTVAKYYTKHIQNKSDPLANSKDKPKETEILETWANQCIVKCKLDCGAQFKDFRLFKNHLAKDHQTNLQQYGQRFKKNTWIFKQVKYCCKICKKVVPHDRTTLTAHMTTHSMTLMNYYQQYVVQNQLCDVKASDDYVKWANQVNFVCQLCSASFDSQTSLGDHLFANHSGLNLDSYRKRYGNIEPQYKIYTCLICQEELTHKMDTLSLHMKTNHNGLLLKSYYQHHYTTSLNKNNECQLKEGQLNEGQLNEGQLNEGQLNEGQLNEGQLNEGQLNEGQLNEGQLNEGQLNEGQLKEGQLNEGQLKEGQLKEGQLNEDEKEGQVDSAVEHFPIPNSSSCEYLCQMKDCGQKFDNDDDLHVHIKNHHGNEADDKKESTTECVQNVAKSKKKTKKSQDTTTWDSITGSWANKCRYRCHYCGRAVGTFAWFRLHLLHKHQETMAEYQNQYGMSYTKKAVHRCRICLQPFAHDRQRLKAHIEKVHKVRLTEYYGQYISGSVEEVTPDKANQLDFKWQFSSFLEGTEFKCQICLQSFTRDYTFYAHIRNYHKMSRPDYISFYGEVSKTDMHNCLLCDNDVVRMPTPLKIHMRDKHGLTVEQYYGRHVMKCHPDKTIDEDKNKTFYYPEWMDHCGFKCKVCDIIVPTKEEFHNHCKIEHDLSPDGYRATYGSLPSAIGNNHLCMICDATFPHTSGDITKHLTDCHGGKSPETYYRECSQKYNYAWDQCPHICRVCGIRFDRADELFQHEKINHGTSMIQEGISVWHGCLVCQKLMPFRRTDVNIHLVVEHKMSLSDYEKKFRKDLNFIFDDKLCEKRDYYK